MKTILITGGTGMVGKYLTNALLQKGYKVIILSRSINGNRVSENLNYALWDIKEQQIDIAALRSADHIIHLAGAGVVEKKWTSAYKKEIADSRIESSRLIFNALSKNENHVRTVISVSAIGWYGADTEPADPFTENNAADLGFLGQTCKLWEESIEPVTGLGKRLVKLRIGIVLSNDAGAFPAFKKPVRFRTAAILGKGLQMISWIHIEDLCRLFITAIENEGLSGSYNAVAPRPVNNKTLIITLARMMNGRFFIPLHIPAFVLKLILGERSIEVLKSCTVSSKKIIDSGFQFRYNTIETALANLVNK